MIQNIEYAPTLMEAAGLKALPEDIQGLSMVPVFKGEKKKVRDSIYYAYYERGEHNVPQHFGVRTERAKLIHFPESDEWNMFDLQKDPQEMKDVYGNDEYVKMQKTLHAEYQRLRKYYDAPAYHTHIPGLKAKEKLP